MGGLLLFGKMTGFTYIFKEDLPRYRYAKEKWDHHHGMPSNLWWIKAQQETFQQCLANSIVLAAPVLIAASNKNESVSLIEVIGWLIWIAAWCFENKADF